MLQTAVFCSLALSTAQGAVSALPAIDRGWYQLDGSNNAGGDQNYFAGTSINSVIEYRNWFSFNVGSVSNVTSAKLVFYAGLFDSDDPTETYSLFDVSTGLQALTDGTGGSAAFQDFASGVFFGDYVASSSDYGQTIEIELNAAAISSIEGANGVWAVGGALTTLDPPSFVERLFAFTSGRELDATQLVLTTVPEPSSALLLGLGSLGFVLRRKR